MGIPEHYLHPKWRDMSEWVVHFTDSAETLRSILADGFVRASGPFGAGKNITETKQAHMSACFSEVPLDHLTRLCARHGHWGVGFAKQFLAQRGGARVWYVEHSTASGQALFDAIGDVLRRQDLTSSLLKLTPFIDSMAEGEPYNYWFDWEREWRVPGGLPFSLDDVSFVMTPGGDLPGGGTDLRLLPSASVTAFAKEAVATLGNSLDQRMARFLEHYTDPANDLPYSSADGGYQWFVHEWDTDDAVDELFGAELSEGDRVELVDALGELSPSWASIAEIETVGE